MKKIIQYAAVFVILASASVKAQNFNYSFNSGSNSYSELSSPAYIASNGNWINSFAKIPIGFSFNYLGKNFDSLNIFNNGYLVFDNNFNYGFAHFAFNLNNEVDSANTNLSSVSYQVQGATGNRILKIQFKDCGISNDNSGLLNYQVWLYEAGNSVALSVGANTYPDESLNGVAKMVGLINMNEIENNQTALLLNGNAASPSTAVINYGEKRTKITGYPAPNTLYTFTPNF